MNNRSAADDALVARRTSAWTTRQKLGRAFWYAIEATLFRWSPQPCYRWRNWLLRLFGAKVHASARIRPTATIEVPWHLTVSRDAIVGDRVILYCLGEITIGSRTVVSQYSHLCAGTHDHTRRDFPLIRKPIVLGDDVWIAADVFVGPGVQVGDGVVVGARSSVFGNLPPWTVCVGTPAKAVGPRELRDPPDT
ncbi:MAG: WcaF family extracellular polysaccharide biosynthesis acetyltransferase [Gemmataceae bacterium]